jgi:hypothetical protein
MDKQTIIAAIFGGFSGLLASLAHLSIQEYFYSFYLSVCLPGIIFGIFVVMILERRHLFSWKSLVWILGSGVSFVVAHWSGFHLNKLLDGYPLGDMFSVILLIFIVLGLSGLVGAVVLLLTMKLNLCLKINKFSLSILTMGTIIPIATVFVTGIDGSMDGIYPSDEYFLLTMTLWQAFMLAMIEAGGRK